MKKIFIDGSAGTTGLNIYDRLRSRNDIEILTPEEDKRKDPETRLALLNEADAAFLCLPDAASVELMDAAAARGAGKNTVVIDTSTAHRVSDGWTYGFPELPGQREKIGNALRIANPGCHATGFIAAVRPLTDAGIIGKDAFLQCFSLTGYSGGGRKMIEDYSLPERENDLRAPRVYGLSQNHKHIPEMMKYSGIAVRPAFSPVVSSFYSGMETVVTFRSPGLTPEDIGSVYSAFYTGSPVVFFNENGDENGFLPAGKLSGSDRLELSAWGGNGIVTVAARFDNLGKGASGAAIQNMNIALGYSETEGLRL